MISSISAGLRRTAYLTIILILFSILIIQFAGAKEENLSISGTKFLDIDSNGIKTPSEPGLAGYTIYWDANNNARWDATEDQVSTDENGRYIFSNLSSGTYIIRESVSSKDKFQLSSPQNGYYSVNLTNKDKKGLDFGNSIPLVSDYVISILFGFLALILIVSGLYALYKSWSEPKTLGGEQESDKKTKMRIQVASGFILLILGLYLLIILLQLSRNLIGAETMINSFALVTPVVLTLLIFGAVLLMLYTQTKLRQKDEVGGMRKTMAGLLVVGLIAVVLFSLSGMINKDSQNIITQYIQLVGIVIAFYFGTKATEDAYKGAGKKDEGDAEKDLDITEVTYDGNAIRMSISNSKKRNFTLKGVSIKDEDNSKFTYTYPEGAAVSESLDPYQAAISVVGDKKSLMDALDFTKEYTITIDTTIGSKSVKRKIMKKN